MISESNLSGTSVKLKTDALSAVEQISGKEAGKPAWFSWLSFCDAYHFILSPNENGPAFTCTYSAAWTQLASIEPLMILFKLFISKTSQLDLEYRRLESSTATPRKARRDLPHRWSMSSESRKKSAPTVSNYRVGALRTLFLLRGFQNVSSD